MLGKILESRGCPHKDIHNWLQAVYLLGYLQRGSEVYAEIAQQLDTSILIMAPK